jgi:hypothetical protein
VYASASRFQLGMYGHARAMGLGDAVSDFNDAGDPAAATDPWTLAIRAIRAVSVPMGQLQQTIDAELNQVSNADVDMSDADFATLQSNLQQMNTYAQQLPALVAAAKSLPEYSSDAATASELNNFLAFAQAWAGSTIAIVAQLPTDTANYLSGQLQGIASATGSALNSVSSNLLKGIAPLLVGGVALALGLLWYTQQAERTRTGRALVRHV